jgi:tripartite-type tricarboxylate transporter receptor subunit TctC
MKLPRRRFLQLAATVPALPALGRLARAQTYPSRPVLLLVGYAPGGVNDIVARLTSQILAERLGQQFIVENRPGAGSNIATEAVARANPDGYTLLEASTSNAWNATLYQNLKFDFIRDIAPVAGVIRVPMVVLVNPEVPAKTLPEFISYAKANPGKVNMASAGSGSAPHMAGELFKMMTGVNMVHVPYRGQGPATTDLLGGQVQILFAAAPGTADYVKTGKLRALAVTTAARMPEHPDVPTVGEFVAGYEASQWYGFAAPKNTPAEIVDKLNKEINTAIADANMKARLAALGGEPIPGSPADFGRLIVDETEKWGKVVRAAGIKPE